MNEQVPSKEQVPGPKQPPRLHGEGCICGDYVRYNCPVKDRKPPEPAPASNSLLWRAEQLLKQKREGGDPFIGIGFMQEVVNALRASNEPPVLREALERIRDGRYPAALNAAQFAERTLLNAPASAPPPPPEWQTMDTAPKDGRKFLAIGMGPMFMCRWGSGANIWMDDSGQWREPRLWQHLPEGPCLLPSAYSTATKGDSHE